MQYENWFCPKFKNSEFETDKFQATGSNFAKTFDVQNRKSIRVTYTGCKHTEIYKSDTRSPENIFDFFII